MDKGSLHALLTQAGLRGIKNTGEGYSAFCPFHTNTRTPAWNINSDTLLWRCFNPDCGQTGNLVLLLTRVAKMSYDEAIKYADNVPEIGTIELDKGWQIPDYDDRNAVQDNAAVLPESTLGLYDRCPKYMLDRGFSKDFLRLYDIGFNAGIGRVTFPARDPKGRLIGFTTRCVDDSLPKYLHDYEKATTLYLLSRVPCGLPIVVSEGGPDALMARYREGEIETSDPVWAGMANAVATMGGGLSETQARLLVIWAPAIIYLGFDNDRAGVAATRKSIKKLREAGAGRIEILTFPSHDLGALTFEDLPNVNCVSYFKWLSSAGCETILASRTED